MAPGLLRDPADPGSIIPRLRPDELSQWEDRASGRIKRKLHALVQLFRASSTQVVIADGRGAHPVADALKGIGTVVSGGADIQGRL